MDVRRLESGVFVRHREGQADQPALFFVHGYGASGTSFLEAFDAPALQPFALCVPDFPGFGESPRGTRHRGLSGAVDLLLDLVAAREPSAGVVLVGHSAGGLVGTMAAPAVPDIRGLVNVEGNLTEADNFISGRAAAADDIDAWRRVLVEEIRGPAERDEAFRRYRLDLGRASAETLKEWAVAIVAETGRTLGGESFRAIAAPKLYVYGGRSIPQMSLHYLETHDVPRLAFPEAGHSPMVDDPARFYAAVAEFVAGCGSG